MATVKELQAHPLEDVPTSSPGSDSPMSSSSTAPAASSSGGAVPRGLVRRLTATHPPAGADDSSATAAPGREGTYTPASETPRTSLVRTGVLSEIVEPGKRIFTDGVRGPGEMPPGGWPSLALGLLIATAYTGWIFIFFFMHVLALLGLFGLLLSGPATAALVTVNALLWATVLLPPPKPYNTWLLKHPMWRHLRTFFSFSIVVDEVPKHEQDGPFLYVHVPHAVFPVSQVRLW